MNDPGVGRRLSSLQAECDASSGESSSSDSNSDSFIVTEQQRQFLQVLRERRNTARELECHIQNQEPRKAVYFPSYIDLFFCPPDQVKHMDKQKRRNFMVEKPKATCWRWIWLCWWRNRACGCFKKKNRLRSELMHLTNSHWFRWFIALVVIGDCIHLATGSERVEKTRAVSYMFLVIYVLEMILKMTASGVLCHRGSYFTDNWNKLDFTLTTLSIFSYTIQGTGLINPTVFRALRAIRILRTISAISSIRVLVSALLSSMRELAEVLLISAFWFLIFALLGMQFFSGVMKRRCVSLQPNTSLTEINMTTNLIHTNISSPEICGNASYARNCEEGYVCLELPDLPNPHNNSLSFDNFGYAMLATLQLIILDEWDEVYRKVCQGMGPWSTLFFIGTTFFGSFQLLNIVLAVIDTAYHTELDRFENTETGDMTLNYSTNNNLEQVSSDSEHQQHGSAEPQHNSEEPQHSNEEPPWKSCEKTRNGSKKPPQGSEQLQHGSSEPQRGSGEPTMKSILKSPTRSRTSSRNRMSTPSPTAKRVTLNIEHGQAVLSKGYFRKIRINMKFATRVEQVRDLCGEAVHHPIFTGFIITLIATNTLLMASEHSGMSAQYRDFLERANAAFTCAFTLELLIKVLVLNYMEFLSDRWNIFDSIIVVISLIDLVAAELFPTLNVIRVFRLLRFLRLARVWATLRILVFTILSSLPTILNMTLVATVLLVTLALFGQHVLDSYYSQTNQKEDIRWSFSDFPHSFMYSFIIMCGSYIKPLRDCLSRAGDNYYICFISLTPIFLAGNLAVLNLYISILLNSFDHQTFVMNIRLRKHIYGIGKRISTHFKKWKDKVFKRSGDNPSLAKPKSSPLARPVPTLNLLEMESNEIAAWFQGDTTPTKKSGSFTSLVNIDDYFTLGRTSMKTRLVTLIKSWQFEGFILVVITLSAACLALDDIHLPSKPMLAATLFVTNVCITAIFAVEMCLKMAAFRPVNYFSDPWNVIDFIIILLSILDHFDQYFGWESSLSAFRALRCFRALRPLRFVAKWPGMKVAVTAMGLAIPGVINVIIMCMILLAIFAIVALNLFSGQMNRCLHKMPTEMIVVPLNRNRCVTELGPDAWTRTAYHFDNIGASYLSLFGAATLDNWVEIYEQAADAVNETEPLTLEANFLQANVFFIGFTIAGAFFTLNLFIGVIIDNFNSLKRQMEGKSLRSIMMSGNQREFFRAIQRLTRVPKQVEMSFDFEKSKIRGMVYQLVHSRPFEYFIMACVMVNVVVMCSYSYNQSEEATRLQQQIDYSFTALFMLEAMLKLYALRKEYFSSGWNALDLLVVIFSVVGIFLEIFTSESLPASGTVIRLVRIFRVFKTLRLVRRLRVLQSALQTMVLSLPALFNVFLLLALAMFIFALMGVQLFAQVKPVGVLDEQFNFQTLLSSMMVLFIMMTATGWTQVLKSLSVAPPDCNLGGKTILSTSGDCGSFLAAVTYTISYIIVMAFILINTYIAIVLENFLELRQRRIINDDDLEAFYHMWSSFDKNADQLVHISHVSDLIGSAEGALRVSKPNQIRIAIMDFNLSEGDMVHCTDLVDALVRLKMGLPNFTQIPGYAKEMIEAKYSVHFPEIATLRTVSSSRQYLVKKWAVNKISQFWLTFRSSLS